MIDYGNTPPWVRPWVDAVAELLDLSRYKLELRFTRFDDDGSLQGRATLNWRSLMARVDLSDKLVDDDNGHLTVVHELVHVDQLDLDRAVERIVDTVPDKLQEHARELWADALEPTTERQARAITAHVGRLLTPNKK